MPFYQMLCIAVHYPEYQHIKQLVHQTATHVMHAGGVVRRLESLGSLPLPQRMKRHSGKYQKRGDYWTMQFDTAPRTLQSLNELMRQDPRVLRWTILKMGSDVETIAASGRHIPKRDTMKKADLIHSLE
ncbi:hypothetical protein AMATHDRAFT_142313 [Amanita thiersii Skay4041]|uniref:Ribosomal protein S6 n=1 Tax=Amanita thiersii Skay4041 TaxID=703135 RepID=A0A2A9NTD5_9AGAR|nr:hypothetical protein AMATHDRAFT_142313 [Amanita thiersii Skay4041]